MARPMIRIRGLEKLFDSNRGVVRAVDHVDLDVAAGEFVVLLGPSGCGKTTTLRCVAGLERPDHGSIEIDGQVVDSGSDRTFVPPERRDIGMVFQSYAVWPHLNVFENVALPLKEGRRRGMRPDEVRARVLEALRLVHLDHLDSRPVTDLSGGQQQRVALARAIVTRPAVLLMDEPLSNLDARLRDTMRTELKRLTLDLGVTTLYVTHDQIEALSLGDRMCVMRDGRILQQGTPEDIYNQPADLFVARFVGDVNTLEGTVSGTDRVDTPIGAVACGLPPGVQVGDAVTLAMRPEHVEVGRGLGPSGADEVEGILLARLFVGDAAVWHVEVGGRALQARVRGNERATLREPVRLRLPREHWHVFPATPAARAGADGALAPTRAAG